MKKTFSIVMIILLTSSLVFANDSLITSYDYHLKITKDDGYYFLFGSSTPFYANNNSSNTTFANDSTVKYYYYDNNDVLVQTDDFTSSSIMDGHGVYEINMSSHDISTRSGTVVFRVTHWVEEIPPETMGIQIIIPAVMVTVVAVLAFLAFRKSWAHLRTHLRGC